jgi:hypothetical protein
LTSDKTMQLLQAPAVSCRHNSPLCGATHMWRHGNFLAAW